MPLDDEVPLVDRLRHVGKLSWQQLLQKPYHFYLARLPRWLTWNLRLTHSSEAPAALGSISKVHLCASPAGLLPCTGENDEWRHFECVYNTDEDSDDEAGSQEALFDVRELETLVGQLSGLANDGFAYRVLAVEDLSPPVMEALGATLSLDPDVFVCHAGDKWKSITDMSMLVDGWLPASGSSSLLSLSHEQLLYEIQYPRVLSGSLEVGTEFQEWCGSFGSSLQNPEETVRLVTLNRYHHFASIVEHVTVKIQKNDQGWTGLLLFPPAIEGLVDSNGNDCAIETLSTPKPTIPAFGAAADGFDEAAARSIAKRSRPYDEWKRLWPPPHDSGADSDILTFLAAAYEYTFRFWDVHCQVLDSLIRQLGAFRQEAGLFDSEYDGTGLHRSQRLKELVVRSQQMLNGNISGIETMLRSSGEKTSVLRTASHSHGLDDALQFCRRTHQRLQQHLPTIQHHVDVVIAKQQIELSRTQLMLSQQATAQGNLVRRISVLAFIFIPISTVSGIFGMNLREFTPNPPIWVFATTAACLMAATTVAAMWEVICGGLSEGKRMVRRSYVVRSLVATWWYYVAEVDYGTSEIQR